MSWLCLNSGDTSSFHWLPSLAHDPLGSYSWANILDYLLFHSAGGIKKKKKKERVERIPGTKKQYILQLKSSFLRSYAKKSIGTRKTNYDEISLFNKTGQIAH